MENVAKVRGFNRFYAGKLAALNEGTLQDAYSLTETRVLYELAQRSGLTRKDDRRASNAGPRGGEERRARSDRRGPRKGVTAGELAALLELDPGYLSRILKRFQAQSWLARTPSPKDRRQTYLELTSLGREFFRSMEKGFQDQVTMMLAPLTLGERHELVAAMQTVERLLGRSGDDALILRPQRSGDMGWLIELHGQVYAQEYKWGRGFESLVARTAAEFLENFKAGREACWIAERNGQRSGSVILVEKSPQVAEMRLLLVDPAARGRGLGGLLVKQCEIFARQAGYEKIFLWTQAALTSARKIFQASGYRLVDESTHQLFGVPSKGQSWVLDL